MFSILLALLVGVCIGIACGLIPGLHPNTTIPLILSLSFLFRPLEAAVILVTAGVVNSFVNYIPSILLGAPESENSLSVLPGHRMFLKGRGYEAIKLTVIGGLTGVFFVMATLPLLFFIIPPIYELARPNIQYLLVFVASYMLITENKRLYALAVFLLSGILGYIALSYSDIMIFPLLSGLFGLPVLVSSFRKECKFPEAVTFETDAIKGRDVAAPVAAGTLAGILAGLLPGIGSTQATILVREAIPSDNKNFLISIGSVNTVDVIYSLFALWIIGNPRSGIAVAVGNLINIGFNEFLLLISAVIASAGIGAYFTMKISRTVIFLLKKVKYRNLSFAVFMLILGLIAAFSGALGLFVGLVALSIGLIPELTGIKRTHAMGCLMIPTILFFLG